MRRKSKRQRRAGECEKLFDCAIARRRQARGVETVTCFRKYLLLMVHRYMVMINMPRFASPGSFQFFPSGVAMDYGLSQREENCPLPLSRPSRLDKSSFMVTQLMWLGLQELHATQSLCFQRTVSRLEEKKGVDERDTDKVPVFFSLKKWPGYVGLGMEGDEVSNEHPLRKRVDFYVRYDVTLADQDYWCVGKGEDESDDWIFLNDDNDVCVSWLHPAVRQWSVFREMVRLHMTSHRSSEGVGSQGSPEHGLTEPQASVQGGELHSQSSEQGGGLHSQSSEQRGGLHSQSSEQRGGLHSQSSEQGGGLHSQWSVRTSPSASATLVADIEPTLSSSSRAVLWPSLPPLLSSSIRNEVHVQSTVATPAVPSPSSPPPALSSPPSSIIEVCVQSSLSPPPPGSSSSSSSCSSRTDVPTECGPSPSQHPSFPTPPPDSHLHTAAVCLLGQTEQFSCAVDRLQVRTRAQHTAVRTLHTEMLALRARIQSGISCLEALSLSTRDREDRD